MTSTISARIDELTRSGVPFVQATVVRAQAPSSARAGDRAVILADGSLEGFVGGHCAAGSVRTAALDALGSGASMLLRVLPSGEAEFPATPGASVVVNPCLSGGALEIYLEPLLPSPVLHVVGDSPIARSLAELGAPLGFVVHDGGEGLEGLVGVAALVVCTHGGDESGLVRDALAAGVGFVGVVCSRTRARAVLAELQLSEAEAARVHTHVGLDIGARTAPEVALSILAAVVRALRVDGLVPGNGGHAEAVTRVARQQVDPVCGMTVTVADATPRVTLDGVTHVFCCTGCRERFVEEHAG